MPPPEKVSFLRLYEIIVTISLPFPNYKRIFPGRPKTLLPHTQKSIIEIQRPISPLPVGIGEYGISFCAADQEGLGDGGIHIGKRAVSEGPGQKVCGCSGCMGGRRRGAGYADRGKPGAGGNLHVHTGGCQIRFDSPKPGIAAAGVNVDSAAAVVVSAYGDGKGGVARLGDDCVRVRAQKEGVL